ncbi:MAG: NADH:flavin oxidoreductase [Clostridium sp.]|nr:NADH:flavin oxidoreductase [Clostridium sp.]
MSSIMYTPFPIGDIQIANRLVASAMFEYGADNGRITHRIKERYQQLAEGGAGLIITGMQAVSASGAIAPAMVNTEYEDYVRDMREIANIVHANGGKVVAQLQHCGHKTLPADGCDNFAVCKMSISDDCIYHEATKEELQKVAADFAASALRCKNAGIDGVQIHGAHGYFINSFLSPSTNHRTDEYGGKIENRARLLFDVYDAVRQAVGNDFIIGVKFPFSDRNEKSIQPEESIFTCKELERRGINFIEVSAGMLMDFSPASLTPFIRNDNQAPFLKYASQLADEVSIPIISVCGYRTPDIVEKALTDTKIAAVSFGRPTVREPNLPNRWKSDRTPAKCISCNRCFNSAENGIITCQSKKS